MFLQINKRGVDMKRNIIAVFFIIIISSTAFSEPLKIVDFNIWFGMDGDGLLKMGEYEDRATRNTRLDIVIKELKEMNPDIIFLQEVNPAGRVTSKLQRELNYSAIVKIYNGGIRLFGLGLPVNLNMALVILAKKELKLKSPGSMQISGPSGLYSRCITFHLSEARFIQAGEVTVGNKKLLLFNTHTHAALPETNDMFLTVEDWLKEGKITKTEKEEIDQGIVEDWARRKKEITAIGDYIEKKAGGEPYILAGDFNTTIDTEEMNDLVKRLNLTDTFYAINPDLPGFTWNPGKNPNTCFDASLKYVNGKEKKGVGLLSALFDQNTRRIDFILLSNSFDKEDVVASRVEFDKPINSVYPSDHFGVYSEVQF